MKQRASVIDTYVAYVLQMMVRSPHILHVSVRKYCVIIIKV